MNATGRVVQLPARPVSQASPSRKVVVLGGSGCVGSAITGALARTGFAPVSVHRRPATMANGIRQIACDATAPDDVMRIVQGACCVVNAIAGKPATMLAATRAMAAAAGKHCRMVHVSSMAVYGNVSGYIDEAADLRANGRYAAAKIACEQALSGTGALILRPGIVYGPGSTQWSGRIGRLLRAGRLGDLGKHGDGRCNLVFADDLGAAVVAAIARPEWEGPINLGMHAPPRWNDFLVAYGRAIGAIPLARLPAWRLRLEAWLAAPPLALAARLAPTAHVPDAISPALCRIFTQDIVLDTRLADRVLGTPQTAFADGLAEAASWFLETHAPPFS